MRKSVLVFSAFALLLVAVPATSFATQPGRNGELVFEKIADQPCNPEERVMAIRPTGKKVRTLSTGFLDVLKGSFGPGGVQLQRIDDVGCRTYDGTDSDLGRFQMDLASGAVSPLPSVLGVVSPDQQLQAFDRYPAGTVRPDLVVSRLDGTEEHVYPLPFLPTGSQGLSQAYPLEWSPAGKRVLFLGFGVEVDDYPPGVPVDPQLYSLTVADGTIAKLTNGPGTFSGTWSPDGREIAFLKKGRVATMSSLGGKPQFVTPKSVRAGTPVWSPSGKQIAFLVPKANNGQSFNIRIIRRDGEKAKTIGNLGATNPTLLWMPR